MLPLVCILIWRLTLVQEAAVQPSLVIVYFGGNDAVHPHPSGLGVHVPLPEYIENMKKIYFHLRVRIAFFDYFYLKN